MKRLLLVVAILLGFGTEAVAQRVVDVCGEYTYYDHGGDVTPNEAKQIALLRARNAALVERFNETVYQSNTTVVSNRNGESGIDFYSIGGSDARGIWIEDSEEPKFSTSYEQGMLVVKASVCGKAKEIVSAGVMIDARVLRNGTSTKNESADFKSGDDMFLYFRTPTAGYLAVYLLERDNKIVYCLLPYRNSTKGIVQVEGDKDYVFFHRDHDKLEERRIIDEYTLTAEKDVEYNDIYIIFSPQPFYKASSTASSDELIPKELSFENFNKWMVQCLTKDSEMVVEKRLIKVTRK